jgi:hypothetical protein
MALWDDWCYHFYSLRLCERPEVEWNERRCLLRFSSWRAALRVRISKRRGVPGGGIAVTYDMLVRGDAQWRGGGDLNCGAFCASLFDMIESHFRRPRFAL